MLFNRRQLLASGLTATAVAATGRFTVAGTPPDHGGSDPQVNARLDQFIEQYMRELRSPGMTLVLADRDGIQRVAAYGFGDLERSRPVRTDELFEIGSISKSFVALCLLQLHDEGKLDLHKPVVDYLPWFRVESRFAPITTHHLLTHGSGLPGNADVFLSDPADRHRAAYAPGEHFHYNNMAFTLLGHLVWTLDGRELPQAIRKRILEPLGMTQTEPAITLDVRERTVKSYCALQNDRPDSPSMPLSEAPGLIETSGAGCVASTARDMGSYIRMLANHGAGPNGRLVSKESFALFCQPHIAADEFGPTAHYGYGIAVDRLEGNTVVRHTGGMVSFMSAIIVDLDQGVGAFASINAMQNYRPTPVVQFAALLMRATKLRKNVAEVAVPEILHRDRTAGGYAGVYEDPSGRRKLSVSSVDGGWALEQGSERISLEPTGEADRFIVRHPDFAHFPLVFARKNEKDPKSAVVEVSWGGEWFAGSAYEGPRKFSYPALWDSYVGHYRNESPWIGSMRVVIRKGRLWLDGVIPLEAAGDRFYLRDEETSPEWVQFGPSINSRCMLLKFSGVDMWRVAAT
ncbi:MAG TPA: serine hydrolase domain-containing protein [Steroidobacteraceae bacterium]|nr:serine hydrolase domain-containing protein [Steroidobacteraceae bacterium]